MRSGRAFLVVGLGLGVALLAFPGCSALLGITDLPSGDAGPSGSSASGANSGAAAAAGTSGSFVGGAGVSVAGSGNGLGNGSGSTSTGLVGSGMGGSGNVSTGAAAPSGGSTSGSGASTGNASDGGASGAGVTAGASAGSVSSGTPTSGSVASGSASTGSTASGTVASGGSASGSSVCVPTSQSCTANNECCNFQQSKGYCTNFGNGGVCADSCTTSAQCASRCCVNATPAPACAGKIDPCATPFVGTWQLARETLTLSNCTNAASNGTATYGASTFQVVVTRSTTTDLQAVDSNGCTLTGNVTGSETTLSPTPQSCAYTERDGSRVALTVDALRFDISGTSGVVSETATETVTAPGGSPITCHLVATVSYVKL